LKKTEVSEPATEPADHLLVTRLKGEESYADTLARKQADKLAAEQARVMTGASLPSAFDAT
jgi:hypothetical protein